MEKLVDPEFIRKTRFLYSSLDGLMFLPPKVAILGEDNDIKIPGPVCYVKERKIADLLRKIGELKVKILEDGDEAKR